MDDSDRGGRDAAGIGPYAREREELVPMGSHESWTVSDGEPDIRGWEVRTVSGRQLGTITDLLIDARAGEVVLLDVDLPGTDRHTFVPIRVVQIDRARRLVLMDSADLPASDLAQRDRAAVAPPDAAAARTVRYPRGDREVVVERSRQPDDVVRDASAVDAGPDGAVERRRAERRRIDRMSTDL